MKKDREEESYNPFEHREVAHPISNFDVYVHMVKGCIGTGILALPEAFKNSGLMMGTFITILAGAIIIHCMLIIVNVQNNQCRIMKVPRITYSQAMKNALEEGPNFLKPVARPSPIIIDTYLVAYQLGTCCVYVLFIAVNIKYVADLYLTVLDERIWMVIILLPTIFLNLLRNLKVLGPVSQIANVIMFTGVGIILYFVFRDLPGFENRVMIGSPMAHPNTFGTALFALCPVAVVLALESEMKTPESFGGWCGILNLGMLSLLTIHVFVGFFGYLKYGHEILSSISLNIPQDNVIAHVIRIIFAAVIFMTYAIQFYVPFDILWNRYTKPKIENHQMLYEYLFKFTLIIGTFLLAIAIPLLGLFISLVGAFVVAGLGIVFPAILEICHCWPDNLGRFKYILVKDLLLLVIGIFVLISGTIISIKDIIQGLRTLHENSHS